MENTNMQPPSEKKDASSDRLQMLFSLGLETLQKFVQVNGVSHIPQINLCSKHSKKPTV